MSPYVILCFLPVVLAGPIHHDYDKTKIYNDITSGRGLYSGFEEIYHLNTTNFKSTVFNSTKPRSWIIEFYNSWCGHCQRFAPTWKKLALDIYRWRDLVSVAAVNCHDPINLILCREYDIAYYPLVKFFPKNSSYDFLGSQVESRTVDKLRHTILNSLIDNKEFKMDQFEDSLNDLKGDSLIVVEEKNSTLGSELALDLTSIKDQLTVVSVNPSSSIVNTLGVSSIPSFYLVKNGVVEVLNFSYNNRSEFVDSVYNYLSLKYNLEKPKEMPVVDESIAMDDLIKLLQIEKEIKKKLDSEDLNLSDVVFQVDIEGALKHILHSEIPRHKIIQGEKLIALKNFLSILSDYFPTGRKGKQFFNCITKYVNVDLITGNDFETGLKECETDQMYLPSGSPPWLGCRGSRTTYRGYPCSLWMTFHTLTVRADINDEPNPLRVLNSITGYVKEFFGCTDCSEHFQEMAKTIESNVTDGKSSVLWLWRAHNSVNKRLAGDSTEDPKHPKVQFPKKESCPQCINSHWNENNVYAYIKNMYTNISFIVIQETDTEPKKIQTRSIKQELYDDVNFQQKKADNFILDLTPFDISLCVLLYLFSMAIIILVCAKFYKQTHRKKNYLFDFFQKV